MEKSNITPELCDALSKLTRSEWINVKYRFDSCIERQARQFFEKAGEDAAAVTCGATAAELEELFAR